MRKTSAFSRGPLGWAFNQVGGGNARAQASRESPCGLLQRDLQPPASSLPPPGAEGTARLHQPPARPLPNAALPRLRPPPPAVHPGRAPAGLPLPARLLVLLLQGRKALPPLPVLLRRRLGHQLRLVAVMAARGRGEAKGGVSAGGGRYRPGAGAAGVGTC